MSRYLERAEHTARLIDVHLNLMLDLSSTSADTRWARVLSYLGVPPNQVPPDASALTEALTFDVGSRSSIVSCIMGARENARQVREQISSEMWEQLNRLFHDVKLAGMENVWSTQPLEFLHSIKSGAHLFQGITDSTMSHGEGWQFIQVGRFVERAGAIATLLDVHYKQFAEHSWKAEPGDHLEWVGVLKACTAFEAYCKVYTAELRPERIAEFLLMNPEFPHSVRFSVDMLSRALASIAAASPARKADRVEKLAGRLRALLSFTHMEEITGPAFHTYLKSIERQLNEIHSAVHQVYIHYPIQSALEA